MYLEQKKQDEFRPVSMGGWVVGMGVGFELMGLTEGQILGQSGLSGFPGPCCHVGSIY